MKLRLTKLTALFVAVMLIAPAQARASGLVPSLSRLVVSPSGPYTTLVEALRDARDGDTIEVHGGTYPAITVDKSVALEGVGWPVIDGGGQGTVVTLAAPDIVFRGFEVRGSGVEPDQDHAGLALTAARVTVEGNRLHDVLFGIFVAQADDAVVRGNDVTSQAVYDEGRKGDGIRVWYSRRARVENNHVHRARDVVLWYSEDVVVRDNLIEGGRYGVHLMYCDRAQIERNRLLNNSVGIYTMYSNGVTLRENLVRGQRGPSGYALGFKDADDVVIAGNVLVDNRVGVFLDGTPFSPQAVGRVVDNVLAFNDIGVLLMPAVRGAEIESNSFWENVEQVAVHGGGTPGVNAWSGNYWSDYTGFDADGDGQGDTPYQAERFFENLTDREPKLRVLLYSPAAQAVEFAASAFPIVRPQPKLTDAAPRSQPAALAAFAVLPKKSGRGAMGIAALALAGLGLAGGALAFVRGGSDMQLIGGIAKRKERPQEKEEGEEARIAAALPPVQAQGLSKRYGRVTALENISFEARAGEAVALWGPNGAGKTTLLKALLGLIEFEGEVRVAGQHVRRAGKNARRGIGYVPQEAVFYDWSVQATLEFYGRLKKVRTERLHLLMERLGLTEHARKPVPALSGGLKQRLALAIALLADPPVLLLDEPTASLDAGARRDYLVLLADLRCEGKTIVFASHRLEEVHTLADRVLVLDRGRLVKTLKPEALRPQLTPEVEMTLWVPEPDRAGALACLQKVGLPAHLNGRGTVVVRVRAGHKAQPLSALNAHGISVMDFELE